MLVGDLAAHGVEAEHISDWTNTGEMTAVEALFVRPTSTRRAPISSRRLWTFADLRRVVRRGDAPSHASAILPVADVA
jgi:hypothetical protein